jgi:transposase
MMGRREGGQGQFFYSFDLDRVVPPDHLVRHIDSLLDLSWVHEELAPDYSDTGRPSIDPVLMIRMLLVGYVFAIPSERPLCSEVHEQELGQVRRVLEIFVEVASFESLGLRPIWVSYS